MALPKTTQSEGLTERIIREAKQFAFYNYCSAAYNPDADFDNIETWPSYAKIAYYSISNYMSGNPLYWPFTDKTTIPMDLKNVAFETALQQWNAGKDVAFKGSVITEPATGIALGCISPEARELLDTIMEQWEKHYASMKEMHGDAMPETTFYGFAYWLVRWSGLVQPAGKEAEEPKPEGWPLICEHCGKQDCESDHK